jgi:hypothetical protein
MIDTKDRTANKHIAFLLPLTALFAATLACGLFSKPSTVPPESSSNPTSSSDTPSTSISSSTATIDEVANTQKTSYPDAFSKFFPLPADTEIDPYNVDEGDPDRGSFTLRSTAALGGLVDFYKTTLPTEGWTYRYTDANDLGGVTQFWKKDNSYISLQFGYEENEVAVEIKYSRLAAEALEKLPDDFPLSDKAELTNALDTMWNFYIDQDFGTVTAFYNQASAGWAPCSGGSFGEGDDGGGRSFPPGITPMPSPTRDPRPVESYCGVLPSQHQIDLYIWPHGDATLLRVHMTSLNLSEAGLPADVPLYPGATIQSVKPGTVDFQTDASLEAVKDFYVEKLTTAGWTPGDFSESAGISIKDWKKGNQSINVSIISIVENECLVTIENK